MIVFLIPERNPARALTKRATTSLSSGGSLLSVVRTRVRHANGLTLYDRGSKLTFENNQLDYYYYYYYYYYYCHRYFLLTIIILMLIMLIMLMMLMIMIMIMITMILLLLLLIIIMIMIIIILVTT